MKKINKKIFPEDFFDLPNNKEELSNIKNKSKQKEHPKLINPSNTIKIVSPEFNEIKEEAFEESVENLQVKKNNLKIIIPDKSNDELEPSTSGSSNVKLSPTTPSPLIYPENNKFKIYPENKPKTPNTNKDEDTYKITAHFVYEEDNNNKSIKNKSLKRPSTPNTSRFKNVYNPPLTCDNKNIDKYKFNYNFETKKNGVIVPKKDNKLNQIHRQNLFKMGYNCNNSNRNKKINNNNKIKPVTSKIEQIFGSQKNTPRETSFISIKNNLYEKKVNKDYNTNSLTNNSKHKTLKKNKNASFIENQKNSKKARANSLENKYINIKKNIADKYDLRVIMLITPETSEDRIRFIDDNTDGFIYMVSSAAITGAQKSFDDAKQEYFRRINAMNLRNPRMIGFGISNKQTLEAAQSNAAGAIIGSKFVTLLNESKDADKALDKLFEALRS